MIEIIRNGIINLAIALWHWIQMAFLYMLITVVVVAGIYLVIRLIYEQDKANGKY